MDVLRRIGRALGRHLRRSFVAGIIILVPVFITYVLTRWLFNLVDSLLRPAIARWLNWNWPGLGILVLIVLVYVIGLLWATVIGKRLIGWAQAGLLEIPLLNAIYQASKDLIESFSGQRPTGFNHVVAIEYPRIGSWALGFLTGIAKDEAGVDMGIIYIPTAPSPQSGWVAIVPMTDVFDVDMPVSSAMRLILSGGIVSPDSIRKAPHLEQGRAVEEGEASAAPR